jgi:hypothetical protein
MLLHLLKLLRVASRRLHLDLILLHLRRLWNLVTLELRIWLARNILLEGLRLVILLLLHWRTLVILLGR